MSLQLQNDFGHINNFIEPGDNLHLIVGLFELKCPVHNRTTFPVHATPLVPNGRVKIRPQNVDTKSDGQQNEDFPCPHSEVNTLVYRIELS